MRFDFDPADALRRAAELLSAARGVPFPDALSSITTDRSDLRAVIDGVRSLAGADSLLASRLEDLIAAADRLPGNQDYLKNLAAQVAASN